jgi:hypothetical protein
MNLSTDSPTSVMGLDLIAEEEEDATHDDEDTGGNNDSIEEDEEEEERTAASHSIFSGHSRGSLLSAQQHRRSVRKISSYSSTGTTPLGESSTSNIPTTSSSRSNSRGMGDDRDDPAATAGRAGGCETTTSLALEEIEEELRGVQARTFASKTAFRTAMQRLSADLREANAHVLALEEELAKATASREERLERYEWARDRREHEVEAMGVERAHLEILRHCLRGRTTREMLAQTGIGEERLEMRKQQQEQGVHVGQSPSLFRYRNETIQELRVMKNRLDGILLLFQKSQKARESTNLAMQAQADVMIQDATSKYILYHKFRQI